MLAGVQEGGSAVLEPHMAQTGQCVPRIGAVTLSPPSAQCPPERPRTWQCRRPRPRSWMSPGSRPPSRARTGTSRATRYLLAPGSWHPAGARGHGGLWGAAEFRGAQRVAVRVFGGGILGRCCGSRGDPRCPIPVPSGGGAADGAVGPGMRPGCTGMQPGYVGMLLGCIRMQPGYPAPCCRHLLLPIHCDSSCVSPSLGNRARLEGDLSTPW